MAELFRKVAQIITTNQGRNSIQLIKPLLYHSTLLKMLRWDRFFTALSYAGRSKRAFRIS